MDVIICIGRIGKHIEGKFNRGFGRWKIEVCNVEGFFTNLKKEFGNGDNKSNKAAELNKVE